jgi:hypothetical protein
MVWDMVPVTDYPATLVQNFVDEVDAVAKIYANSSVK